MDAPKRIWTDWKLANDACVAFDEPPASDTEGFRTEYILASEHDRIVAEKDARIAELERQRLRVDRRIRRQREQLAWWNKMFSERLGSACRRRIYYPRWMPVLYRRAKVRAALKGDDNG